MTADLNTSQYGLIRQAVILTGGRGTRLGALTDRIPKGLVRVAGRPFLEHLLLYLRGQGIGNILLCAGYLGEMIEEYFGDGRRFGMEIDYSREDSPRGTGGALKLARELWEDWFFLLNGDTFVPVDYRQLEREFFRSGVGMLLGAYPGSGLGARPNLRLGGEGRVTAVRLPGEKGEFTHLDAGVRAVSGSIADFFPPADVFSLEEDLYPRLITAGELGALEVEEPFYDIGTPERIKIFAEYLTGRAAK
ncbi:MAG: sugar phosphate nucleotidyltransferase [Candidatus Erginobacter occultus]|nr:sugar phosphate nucleotidyltransferase [Candidatus Erginobacter occultus]